MVQQVVERADVVAVRSRYLREIEDAREKASSIYYLDETRVNGEDGKHKKEWLDRQGKRRQRQAGQGGRCVIVDIGS
jgi:hypothetical protein